jgi:hypothetical protein
VDIEPLRALFRESERLRVLLLRYGAVVVSSVVFSSAGRALVQVQ